MFCCVLQSSPGFFPQPVHAFALLGSSSSTREHVCRASCGFPSLRKPARGCKRANKETATDSQFKQLAVTCVDPSALRQSPAHAARLSWQMLRNCLAPSSPSNGAMSLRCPLVLTALRGPLPASDTAPRRSNSLRDKASVKLSPHHQGPIRDSPHSPSLSLCSEGTALFERVRGDVFAPLRQLEALVEGQGRVGRVCLSGNALISTKGQKAALSSLPLEKRQSNKKNPN